MTLKEQHCSACHRTTSWEVHRSYEVCAGCRKRFPCAGACEHVDCQEARGQLATCAECKFYKPAGAPCERCAPPAVSVAV